MELFFSLLICCSPFFGLRKLLDLIVSLKNELMKSHSYILIFMTAQYYLCLEYSSLLFKRHFSFFIFGLNDISS